MKKEHYDILKSGIEKWNQWRVDNFEIIPNLRRANLSGADLSGASLRRADLSGANLSGADIDFSCWPLWCGSFDVKVDKRIVCQLAYHFCKLDCDDPEVIAAQNDLTLLANQSHIIEKHDIEKL